MKKIYSLIRACMTSDMRIFKIKTKNNKKKSNIMLLLFISLGFMLAIWSYANILFEKMAPMHIQFIVLSLFVFMISIMTMMEGIYKTGPLIFNCKDDQLLLSLPIKRRTVLFVRVFKFYVFELLFNSLFMVPLMVAYMGWADSISWTYFLTSFVMIFFLPIIPIVISCIIGFLISSVSSKFKYKNMVQIAFSFVLLVTTLFLSYNSEGLFKYIVKHAKSIHDMITKLYYPAGIYATLVTDFNIKDLIVFIFVNISIFVIFIFILSKFYYRINSRLKSVSTNKKVSINKLVIKSNSKYISLIKKELNTFFKIPVFIINAGFGLILYIIATIMITIKYDSVMSSLTNIEGINIPIAVITNSKSLIIFALVSATAFMTSITNSVISLEGRNINILKSLPLKTKTILMSKIYSSLVLTTPVLLIGNIILFIKFKISVIEMLLLLMLSILIPLVSHFIGLIINLKFPKLDAENSTEVVKQSASSFLSVMIGMVLLLVSMVIIYKIAGKFNNTLILLIATIIYIIIDTILYMYLTKKSIIDFNNLSI
ncbi:MAG: hypothetical protein VZS44_06910 [Bacilli bacterium]|nr:hypothetical protein [Bacilli bacterium]